MPPPLEEFHRGIDGAVQRCLRMADAVAIAGPYAPPTRVITAMLARRSDVPVTWILGREAEPHPARAWARRLGIDQLELAPQTWREAALEWCRATGSRLVIAEPDSTPWQAALTRAKIKVRMPLEDPALARLAASTGRPVPEWCQLVEEEGRL